ncbi:piggyBac transposable element-derived protein 2-like [Sitophilus oryzae]|uniref:PiggyBac transposable element-derived protein 2-like n=1 Tax=Sitophilus oryzae TaxID=7048 RepID=A0A6J2YGH6_SITOR|nr:piggyBac transposable element-derived protein 2-like [Sitophilus oryzae]
MIEEDDFPHASTDIILFPPNDGWDTDEDSGEEDAVSPDNLPSAQLRAPAEIQVPVEDDDSDDDNIPLARLVTQSKQVSKVSKTYNWTDGHISYESGIFESTNDTEYQEYQEEDPYSIFSKLFDENIFDILIEETNRYALSKNTNSRPVTIREMKSFVGILVLSGYVLYPRRKMFWEKDKDVHNPLVSGALSRDRFDYIMSVFHIADNNNLTPNDKFAKIRPLFTLLNQNFLKHAPHIEYHSVDEAMVPYFGRHGAKQFIKGKPIRWGVRLLPKWIYRVGH